MYIAVCGGIILEDAFDQSLDRLLMMMMMKIYIYVYIYIYMYINKRNKFHSTQIVLYLQFGHPFRPPKDIVRPVP